MQEPESLDPAVLDGLVLERLRVGARVLLLQLVPGEVDLLLDDVLEGCGDGTALRRIAEADLAHVARILEVGPLVGLVGDAEALEAVAVVEDAVAADHGPEPAALLVPVFLAAKKPRDDRVLEPFRVRTKEAAVHDATGLGLLREIIVSATEEEIDPAAHLRGEKIPARLHDVGRGVSGQLRGDEPRLDVAAPAAVQRVGPSVLERGDILALEVARDVACAAHDAPVNVDRPPGPRLVPFLEARLVLVADGLVVRRDDHKRVVGVLRGGL